MNITVQAVVDVEYGVSRVTPVGYETENGYGLPICWPSFGGCVITFPIKIGDTVLSPFCNERFRWLGNKVIQVKLRPRQCKTSQHYGCLCSTMYNKLYNQYQTRPRRY